MKREGKRGVRHGRKKAFISVHYWGWHRKLNSLGNSEKYVECFPELFIWMIRVSFHYPLPAFPHLFRVAPALTKSPKYSDRSFHCVGEVPRTKSRKMGDRNLKWVPCHGNVTLSTHGNFYSNWGWIQKWALGMWRWGIKGVGYLFQWTTSFISEVQLSTLFTRQTENY